ncbi:hypothetical protein SRDD_27040 [Serratia sp. DD3]|nr:hypothetical protein SRDD_27040 [Serratia sp. DD3]
MLKEPSAHHMTHTEKVPYASTLSQNCSNHFNHSVIFQQIFNHIVGQALSRGQYL